MVILITWLIRSSSKDQRLFRWALTFQLGGALGNLLDRGLRTNNPVTEMNGVVDFLDFGITINNHAYNWPTFNFADVFVVIGTFFLIIYLVKAPPPESSKKTNKQNDDSPEEPLELEEVNYDIGMREGLQELEPLDEFDSGVKSLDEPETDK